MLGEGHTAEATSYLAYGLAACLMWLRTLNFVLVQQDLGQVLGRDREGRGGGGQCTGTWRHVRKERACLRTLLHVRTRYWAGCVHVYWAGCVHACSHPHDPGHMRTLRSGARLCVCLGACARARVRARACIVAADVYTAPVPGPALCLPYPGLPEPPSCLPFGLPLGKYSTYLLCLPLCSSRLPAPCLWNRRACMRFVYL